MVGKDHLTQRLLYGTGPKIPGTAASGMASAVLLHLHREACHPLKILWATTPSRLPLPFLQGPMAWTTWGPPYAPYTPPKVLRSLCHAIAVCCQPWKAGTVIEPKHIWYVDGARSKAGYVAAMWDPELGCCTKLLPHWISSQRSAELAAIGMAIKLVAKIRLPAIHLGADNLAAMWSTIKLFGAVGNPYRLLRQIAHTMRLGRVQVKLSWVPSKLNPADHPSKLHEFPSATLMHANAWATFLVVSTQANHLLFMGLVGSGG